MTNFVKKNHNFLNERLNFKGSKPNSGKSFSDDVPFIAPVIAMDVFILTRFEIFVKRLINPWFRLGF